MKNPKLRAALVVLFVGCALGVAVFAASRLFARSVLNADPMVVADALFQSLSATGMVAVGLAVLAISVVTYAVGRSGPAGKRKPLDPTRLPLDPLTGALTRQGFTAALADAVGRAAAADAQIGLLIVNLDEFHAVNDVWGHLAGDAVLKAAADRLRGFATRPATLARISGDHFAVIVEGDATPIAMRGFAEKLQEALRAPFPAGESSIALGASIGAALFPVNADNADMLFRAADIALSKAKAEKRSALAFFDTDMKRRMQRRGALERDLRHALDREEFVLFYQPQLDLASGRVRGYEALLRWERPGEGILAPAEFFAVAEETGLIHPIGDWALRKACADATGWPGAEIVAVNFCPAQFRSRDLARSIQTALAKTGLPAERLEIEVPERLFLQQDRDVMDTLKSIKALGVRIAMDDFGAGYSSLSSLAQFPFDKIKIDKSFVSQLDGDGDVSAIVASIVGLGRALSVDITAEGVETSGQVTLLKAAGCNIVQGFLFGVPQSGSAKAGVELESWADAKAAGGAAG